MPMRKTQEITEKSFFLGYHNITYDNIMYLIHLYEMHLVSLAMKSRRLSNFKYCFNSPDLKTKRI